MVASFVVLVVGLVGRDEEVRVAFLYDNLCVFARAWKPLFAKVSERYWEYRRRLA